jgi:hypothetical protein
MQSQQHILDLYRASLRSATDMMNASLQQSERLQQQQLEIMRGALEETERTTQQIATAKSFDDTVSLNSRVAGTQLERDVACGGRIAEADGRTNAGALEPRYGAGPTRLRLYDARFGRCSTTGSHANDADHRTIARRYRGAGPSRTSCATSARA